MSRNLLPKRPPAIRMNVVRGVSCRFRDLPETAPVLAEAVYQFLLIESGSGRITAAVGDTRLDLGGLYLVPAGLASAVVAGRTGCRAISCWFGPDELPLERSGDRIERSSLDLLTARALAGDPRVPVQAAAVRPILSEMAAEDTASRLGAWAMTRSLLQRLLVVIARQLPAGDLAGRTAGSGHARIAAALAAAEAGADTVSELARAAGVSPGRLHTLFVSATGSGPKAWIARRRRLAAQRLVVETDLPLAEVARQAGYPSLSRLHAAFAKAHGEAPGRLRRRTAAALEKARRLLLSTRLSPATIAGRCGLIDGEHLTRLCELRLGASPEALRNARSCASR